MAVFVLVTGLLFAVSSLFHGTRNSLRRGGHPFDGDLLGLHYAFVGLFLIAAVAQSVSVFPLTMGDLCWGLAIVFVIQAGRIALDLGDRSYAAMKNIEKLGFATRHIADALADFSVMYITVVALELGNKLEVILSAFIASMLVAKEYKYRLYDDLKLRSRMKVAAAHGGVGPRTRPALSRGMAFSRVLKSAAYIIIGISLLFSCLSTVDIKLKAAISHGSGHIHLIDAIVFGARSWQTIGDSDFWATEILSLGVIVSGLVLAFSMTNIDWRATPADRQRR